MGASAAALVPHGNDFDGSGHALRRGVDGRVVQVLREYCRRMVGRRKKILCGTVDEQRVLIVRGGERKEDDGTMASVQKRSHPPAVLNRYHEAARKGEASKMALQR